MIDAEIEGRTMRVQYKDDTKKRVVLGNRNREKNVTRGRRIFRGRRRNNK